MRRWSPVPWPALSVLLALSLSAPALAAERGPMPYAPGEVLVVVDAAQVAGDGRALPLRLTAPAAEAALARLGLGAIEPVGAPVRATGARVLRLRSARPDFDPVAAARELSATGAFRAACPNHRLRLFALPNDPLRSEQWYVDDGPGGDDIRLPAAWDVTHGDTSVVIAVMDTGIDGGHPDLLGRIRHNPGEIAGNGIDDDLDGYVDDVAGWDFGSGDADPSPEYTTDPSGIDVGFHGTFCAGIAAAATDNGVGISGAAWQARLLPLKVSHPDSGITGAAVAAAFLYAADQQVDVLSMSFGGPGDPGVPEFFQALVDIATGAGVVCVAAAGNDSTTTLSYPAACSGVLAVGATEQAGDRAWFSNWGAWVDVSAPGSFMYSTICRNYTFTEIDEILYMYFFGWDGYTPYMYGEGTSFACPLVAGTAALVRARYPTLGPLEVQAHLVATGDAMAYDLPMGPRVNAHRAVSAAFAAADAAAPPATLSLRGPWPMPARAGAAWSVALALPRADEVTLELFDVRGRRVAARPAEVLGAGATTLRWAPEAPAAGVYFLRVRTRLGEQATARVAVMP